MFVFIIFLIYLYIITVNLGLFFIGEVTGENSVFTYPIGESAANYSYPNYVPYFLEDFNATLRQSAISLCGEGNDPCIFDYLITSDPSFAQNTKTFNEEGDQTRRILGKFNLALVF